MPHSAQPQHTNDWAPRTRKRHQQEHRPQRPTESSDPAQHAKGRTGDRPGPRKETTRRNVTQGVRSSPPKERGVGGMGRGSCDRPVPRCGSKRPLLMAHRLRRKAARKPLFSTTKFPMMRTWRIVGGHFESYALGYLNIPPPPPVGTTDQGRGNGSREGINGHGRRGRTQDGETPMGTTAYGGKGQGKGKGSREGVIGQGGRGRSQGGERPMGTTPYGGNGSKGRAANSDRPVGATSCR